jgi:excisionase family DNA binding protein
MSRTADNERQPTRNARLSDPLGHASASKSHVAQEITEQELLTIYLGLPKERRHERFTDTAQAAEFAGVSRRTIQFWIEIGAVRAITIGRRYRISRESLQSYLASQVGG